jgi:hypothetical protein
MKVRRHSRNIFCKVNGHKWKNLRWRWQCFACGRHCITRRGLIDALLPGLNALFNLEYENQEKEHRSLFEEYSK